MSVDPRNDPNSKPGANGPGWEERLHEAGNRMEEELKKVITYINDEVVPEVRRNGSDALRAAAQQMEKLAQKMDERARSSSTRPPSDEAK
jgi:hypothetical protein